MEEVFQSMQGSKRAQPQSELFHRIQEQLAHPTGKVVSMRQWSYAAAVAAVILLLNTLALSTYLDRNTTTTETVATTAIDTYSESLISTYQIYE